MRQGVVMAAAPPADEMLNSSRQPDIIASNICVMLAAVTAVNVRIFSRRTRKLKLGSDDYTILAALVIGVPMVATNMIGCYYGLGKHTATLDAVDYVRVWQAFVAQTVLWTAAVALTKISILLLYLRVFGCMFYFRIWAAGLGTFCLLWSLMGIFVLAFACMPFSGNWLEPVDEAGAICIDRKMFYLVSSGLEVITDILLLAIPLPAIWLLRLPVSQKIEVTFTFLFASLTCAVGIARWVVIYRMGGDDPSWQLAYPVIWSAVEVCLGIVSACLACMKPLLQHLFQKVQGAAETQQPLCPIPNSHQCIRHVPSGPFDKYRRPSEFYQNIEDGMETPPAAANRLSASPFCDPVIQQPLAATAQASERKDSTRVSGVSTLRDEDVTLLFPTPPPSARTHPNNLQ